jgi:methylthioribose-1-phosphate isomerase
MIVGGNHYQSIWPDPGNPEIIRIIDQNRLPFEFRIDEISNSKQAHYAIRTMKIRGAPLIGVTGAFGVYLACLEAGSNKNWKKLVGDRALLIRSARPTAVNLAWAVDRVMRAIGEAKDPVESIRLARQEAVRMMEEEKEACFRIGRHGLEIIREISLRKKGHRVNVLTHCNAGWLACIDYGTATAPVYMAHDQGIPVHVWVDETRPRNQGARLTAWELGQHGVPHTVVVDNAGGYLMQRGLVDLVLVGSDRTTRTGDVANKIGTYLKALAAYDNELPFYAALPSSSIDFGIRSGLKEIRIEERDHSEVREIEGSMDGEIRKVQILPAGSPVSNYGFDITPARLVTGLITERGICAANEEAIMQLFPEKKP